MEPRVSILIQAAAPRRLCDAVRWDRSTGAGCDSSLDSERYGAPAVAVHVVHQLELEDAFIDIDIDNPA